MQRLVYTEDAKQRLNTQGLEVVRSFLSLVPRQQLTRLAARLPKINGFRPAHVADEQVKRLARRLTTFGGTDAADWQVMADIWVTYCMTRIATELGTVLIEADRSRDNPTTDPAVVEDVRKRLIDVAKTRTVPRERLDVAVQLSPFAEITGLLAATRDAPTSETIEQAGQLDEAKRRLVEINGRLARLETRDDLPSREALARVEDVQTQVNADRAALASALDVIETIQQIGCEDRFAAVATDMAGLSQRLDDATASLRQSTDKLRTELTAEHSALRKLLDESPNAPETPAAAIQLAGTHPSASTSAPTPSIAILREDLPARAEPQIATSTELRSAIAQSMYALGLSRDSSMEAALEVAAGIIAGQVVSFRGSLSGIMAATVRASFPGPWDNALIPIGIGDAITLTEWHRTEVGRNLLLSGVNHSAFEIYGPAIRQEVVSAQLAASTSERLYLAVVTEGAGALPLIRSFVDLGPVVDTDSLDWRVSGSSVATPTPNGDFHELRRGFNLIDSLGDAKGALDEARESFAGILSALGMQTINRALGALIETHGNDDEAVYWRSLFFSWVHPQMRAAKLTQNKAHEALSKSVFASVLSTDRGRRLLGQLGAQ